ncbi:HAD-IIB family hydrolase [Psychromonas aquatilis]|uniref:HAD-IIB family hydrolase n=1 Tax=Psychromonas aquatilis TaxID=2005072 RepID=A0ABU9GRJ3_9GAMM
MNKKILVFTDLDGTLLDHYTYQTDAATDMLAKLKSEDIAVIPNSSKTFSEISLIREQLQLNSPFIIENGAAVYIPINYFNAQPEGTSVEGDYWVKSFCQPKAYWLALLSDQAEDFKAYYQGFSEMTLEQLVALTGLSIENAEMAKQRHYGEPLNWLGDEQTQNAFTAHMIKLGANVLQGGRFLHISGHTDKGQAQAWLAKQYQGLAVSDTYLSQAKTTETDPKTVETIALGDGKNDIAMLEQATFAVQVRSPVHDFPELSRTENVYQSRQFGPAGWTECLEEILSSK